MLRLGREQGAQSRLQQSWVCSSVTPEPGLGWTLPHSRALWGFGVLRWTFWVYPFSSSKKFSSRGLECVWNLGCILYWSFQCLFAPLCLLIQLQTCPCRGWILLCSCPEARALAAVLSLSVWADTGRTGEQPQSLGGMAKGKFVFILLQAGGIRRRQVPQSSSLLRISDPAGVTSVPGTHRAVVYSGLWSCPQQGRDPKLLEWSLQSCVIQTQMFCLSSTPG